MKSWRRYKNISGGMVVEKVVHDFDLCFYFLMTVFNIKIDNIEIESQSSKNFWISENENNIMNIIQNNQDINKIYHKWDTNTTNFNNSFW